MPWLMVNHTRLAGLRDVPTPLFALDVQRAGLPGHPGAYIGSVIVLLRLCYAGVAALIPCGVIINFSM